MRRGLACTALLLVIIAVTNKAIAAPDVRVPGIYSDLTYNNDSGDLHGTELFIVVAPDDRGPRYSVFFQCWGEGGFDPVAIPAKVDGDKVSFIVPPPSVVAGAYEGRITKSGFDGSYRLDNGNTSSIHLKRKKSYWE